MEMQWWCWDRFQIEEAVLPQDVLILASIRQCSHCTPREWIAGIHDSALRMVWGRSKLPSQEYIRAHRTNKNLGKLKSKKNNQQEQNFKSMNASNKEGAFYSPELSTNFQFCANQNIFEILIKFLLIVCVRKLKLISYMKKYKSVLKHSLIFVFTPLF